MITKEQRKEILAAIEETLERELNELECECNYVKPPCPTYKIEAGVAYRLNSGRKVILLRDWNNTWKFGGLHDNMFELYSGPQMPQEEAQEFLRRNGATLIYHYNGKI